METLSDLQISCQKCKIAFKLGDHVLMTKKTHFFHLLCYKSKGKFYRYFNKAATFVTWTDSRLLTEYVAAVDELIKFKRNLEKEKSPKKFEQLKSLQLTKTRKSEIVVVDENVQIRPKVQFEGDESFNKDLLHASSSSTKLAENLTQLMSDVDAMKSQISYFSDEKVRDENRIKQLHHELQKLKMQNCELRWYIRNQSMDSPDLNTL